MNDRIHGIVILGVGRGAIDELLGLRGNATNGVATDGVGIVVDAIIDEGVTNGILIGGALWNCDYVANVVGTALWGVGYILLVGVIGFDNGTAIIALGVAVDGI